MPLAKITDWIFGKHLMNSEEGDQRVGPFRGIPILGLDALSSAAYGPEAALTVLLPLGALGLHFVLPITCAIVILLVIVFLSYRQTIQAYPGGGGSYTVAKQNLGRNFGLLAAVALLLDYVLVVAVGISAGVGALISALPILQPYTLILCNVILIAITLVNLRGAKESGVVFMFPTYAFVLSLLGVIAFGIFKTIAAGGAPQPVEAVPILSNTTEAFSIWILLRAFASGCTAMTGVEAVSNGVKAFREPVVDNARKTLTAIILILILMLIGIAYLSFSYKIGATEPGLSGYESMISQLVRAIVGRGFIYYFTIGSVVATLAFSANTGFADFPRLCQIIASDNFLPHSFAQRGRRLVFSYGIIVLAILSGILLFIFNGVTDRLIPLFAIGAFLAFTLSQAGMVAHWLRQSARHSWLPLTINLLGALSTAVTLIVVFFSKFAEGAWITAIIIPCFLLIFLGIRKHYFQVAKQIQTHEPLDLSRRQRPVVIIPIKSWNKTTRKALKFAMDISENVYAVNVRTNEHTPDVLPVLWKKYVTQPSLQSGAQPATLVTLTNPYRKLFGSMLSFIDELETEFPDRKVAIVIPNLAEFKWYHHFLHNQRAVLLSAILYLRRDRKIVVITVPWFLED